MKELVIKDFCYISDGNYSSKYPRSDEFKESGIPFIRANNLVNGTVVSNDMYFISPEKHLELRKGHLQTDDVLITTRGNIGQTAVVPAEFHDANINAQIVLLRVDKEKIAPKYLEYALHADAVVQQIESCITGTALKQLPVGRLEKIKVKIHPKNEQEHIVSVLQKIDALISAQKEQLETIETIVKSRFIELFGSVEDNVFGLETIKIKDACDLINGKAFKPEDWSDEGLPIVRIQNLNNDQAPFNFFNGEITEQYLIDTGELLFSWSGTPGTSFGAFFWNRGKAVLNQHIFRVKPKIEFNLSFLQFALNGRIDYIISKAHGGVGLQHITKKELDEVELLLPAIELQNQFATFVEQTDKLKFEVKQSLEKLETLKKSLMQQYFG